MHVRKRFLSVCLRSRITCRTGFVRMVQSVPMMWHHTCRRQMLRIAFLPSLQEDIWSEESMKGWDDADMGTWSDSTLENNSTWNSATGFNKNLRKNSLTKVFTHWGVDSDIIIMLGLVGLPFVLVHFFA